MIREKAWRIFSGEYNDSSYKLKGEGDMAPSYLITPLGAKVNRLFIIGVVTEVEKISEMVRARVSDPTGTYTIYSGQYQPETTRILSEIEVPNYLAVVGKSRIYEPEEGVIYASVRPEIVKVVGPELRDYWILETCRRTKDRIEGMMEAMEMDPFSIKKMIELGYEKNLAEGIAKAIDQYGEVDLDRYRSMLNEALAQITSRKIERPIKISEMGEIEKEILSIIEEMEGEKGAPWDKIVEKGKERKFDREVIEEALSSLMDRGIVYEPILGRLKTT
jgi:hypothetical protein